MMKEKDVHGMNTEWTSPDLDRGETDALRPTLVLCLLAASIALGSISPARAGGAPTLAQDLSELHLPAIDIYSSRWSPDGHFLVYFANVDFNGESELHSVLASGPAQEPNVLSRGRFVTTNINFLVISPDSQYVLTRKSSDLGQHLVSIPIGGGSEVDLLGPRPSIGGPTVDSNGQVYTISSDGSGQGVFRVSASGGAPTRLTPPPPGSLGLSTTLWVSPDDQTLAYLRRLGAGPIQLVTVPAGGGTPTVVSAPVLFPQSIDFAQFTADSSHLIYRVKHPKGPRHSLHTAPVGGPTSIEIQSLIAMSGPIITADGTRVAYSTIPFWPHVEFFSAATDGSSKTEVFDSIEDGLSAFAFRVSDATNRLLFIGDDELYSTPLTGGPFTKVSAILTENGRVRDFTMSPDGNFAIYRADGAVEGRLDVYSVPAASGPVIRLNDPAIDPASVDRYGATNDHVYFERSGRIASAPLAGGSDLILSHPLVFGGEIESMLPSPGGSQLAYLSQEDSSAAVELYEIPIAGGDVTRRSLTPREVAGEVTHHEASSDGRFVVFRAERDTLEIFELYSRRLADGLISKLNPPLELRREVATDFQLAGDRAFFRSERANANAWDLYSASLEPAAAETGSVFELLSDGVHSVSSFIVDGDRLIYLADGALYQVPTFGGMPTVLDAFDGQVRNFKHFPPASSPPDLGQHGPGEALILFAGSDSPTTSGLNLWVMPAQGGAPTFLGGTLAGSASLTKYGVSPDRAWAYYIIDTFSSDRIRSVRIDGTDHQTHSPSSVSSPVFTSTSSHLLGRSGDVFSIPVGTDDVTVISQPEGTAGYTGRWQLTPDDRVIFEYHDLNAFEPTHLMSVAATGGPIETLSPQDTEIVWDFRVTPDGQQATFEAEATDTSTTRLYSAPTSGGPPTALSGGLNATPLGFTTDSSLAFYTSANIPLQAEPLPAGPPIPLAPDDFTGIALDAKAQSDGVFFRALHHDRKTSLHFSSLEGLLLVDGFESGDTSAWSLTVP